MKVYSIKVALRGISPMIWRRLRIAGDTSLAGLHSIIKSTQGWDDNHLHQFHIYGRDYDIWTGRYENTANLLHQSSVTINDFEFDTGDRFTYASLVETEINFVEKWVHDIRIESIEEYSTRKKTPFCISGNGMLGAKKYDYSVKLLDVLQIIFDEDDSTTTVGEVRRHIEELDKLRLNRKRVNRTLADLNLKKIVRP